VEQVVQVAEVELGAVVLLSVVLPLQIKVLLVAATVGFLQTLILLVAVAVLVELALMLLGHLLEVMVVQA
jgi:hypothetical protein